MPLKWLKKLAEIEQFILKNNLKQENCKICEKNMNFFIVYFVQNEDRILKNHSQILKWRKKWMSQRKKKSIPK